MLHLGKYLFIDVNNDFVFCNSVEVAYYFWHCSNDWYSNWYK